MSAARWGAAVVAAVALLWISGIVHGKLSYRWQPHVDVARAAERLSSCTCPMEEWSLIAKPQLKQHELDMLKCIEHFTGLYEHKETGDEVSVTILLGPPGNIWSHRPEGCYGFAGFVIQEIPQRIQVRAQEAPQESLWTFTCRSEDIEPTELRIHYAWSDGGGWESPDSPRLRYAGRPYLYKLMVIVNRHQQNSDQDISRKFLQAFLPVVSKCLLLPSGLGDTQASAIDAPFLHGLTGPSDQAAPAWINGSSGSFRAPLCRDSRTWCAMKPDFSEAESSGHSGVFTRCLRST